VPPAGAFLSKVTYIRSKEPCIRSKEPCNLSEEPYVLYSVPLSVNNGLPCGALVPAHIEGIRAPVRGVRVCV